MPHFIVIIRMYQPNAKLEQYDLSTSTNLSDRSSGITAMSAVPHTGRSIIPHTSQSQFGVYSA